jgi:bifunctional non-homologous end joining protein LigD
MTTKRLTVLPGVTAPRLPSPLPDLARQAPERADPPPQLPLERARLPESLMPMFPGGASEPFDSREHVFEVRWDGLRALAFVEGGGYHLQDQSGRNISELFPELGEIPRRLAVDEVILDGIVVISDSQGRPDFAALDRRMRLSSPDGLAQAAARQPAAFVVFDILYAEARSVMSMTLLKRRRLLKEVLAGEGRVCLSDAVGAEGVAFFDAAREMGIEAVIAKRKDSVYVPGGRSPSWLLVQDVPRQDVVVIGYLSDSHGGAFESLLMGIYSDHQLVYAGAVGGGFDQRTERLLAQALPGLRSGGDKPDGGDRVPGDAIWVRPELVASVKFSEWTPEGTLRFPIFVGMHPEVDARSCTRQPIVPPRPAMARRRKLKIELPQLPFAVPEGD